MSIPRAQSVSDFLVPLSGGSEGMYNIVFKSGGTVRDRSKNRTKYVSSDNPPN